MWKKKKEDLLKKQEIRALSEGGIFFIGSQDSELLSQFENEPDDLERFKKKNSQNQYQNINTNFLII